MQKAEDVKTESVLRLTGFLLLFLVVFFFSVYRTTDVLRVNNTTYLLKISSTKSQLINGLSDTQALPQNTGMLFILPNLDYQCFWMKGMKFNLDIIWLNSEKKVIKIEQNLSPSTYPNNYCPSSFARYVLEMNSGFIKTNKIRLGQVLNF
jgi:uncharacterized protein